jgi:Acyl-coenzyme A:6-aminopenicillanic acid acyl-transferase
MRRSVNSVRALVLIWAVAVFSSIVCCDSYGEEPKKFADKLTPLLNAIAGKTEQFRLTAEIKAPIDKQSHTIRVELVRDGNDFDLRAEHSDYALNLRHRANGTALALPKHKVVFVGTGELETVDSLDVAGLSKRLFSPRSDVGVYAPMILDGNSNLLVGMAQSLLGLKVDEASGSAQAGDVSIRLEDGKLLVASGDISIQATLSGLSEKLPPLMQWGDYEVKQLDRNELETTLVRGVRRAFEILLPGEQLKRPQQENRKTENGELQWIGGQRVVTLRGTPEQIGKAHGELLKEESNTCIDSVLYTFGTAQTIVSGKWFRSELDGAFAQLVAHIPSRFREENKAMAIALGRSPETVDALNVFPEMFHCSGFAIFGAATVDGKLYHGRVLDYMTTIGLQDAATNFIVSPVGKIPFANVGYAGFTGSVSGMNDAQVSLGEMGGRGEGQWNGVPMATLMRIALEECTTLEQVKQLWTSSPRTCEYYYVFADGKTNEAVGVAAVPEKVEFILPGQSDPRLGEGIKDTVLLSAGDRLQTLRARTQENYGKIDVEKAIWLMSRPVAMKSNLHNVLFVPADKVMYVANADHKRPAAERPYIKIDFGKLVKEPVEK